MLAMTLGICGGTSGPAIARTVRTAVQEVPGWGLATGQLPSGNVGGAVL